MRHSPGFDINVVWAIVVTVGILGAFAAYWIHQFFKGTK